MDTFVEKRGSLTMAEVTNDVVYTDWSIGRNVTETKVISVIPGLDPINTASTSLSTRLQVDCYMFSKRATRKRRLIKLFI